MALVSELEEEVLTRETSHKAVRCTYSVVNGPDGELFLQLDTYGSAERVIRGKKSQSVRLTADAVRQLVELARKRGFAGPR